nr:hypothetical protein [uncultured Blautia sp.]
MYTERRKGGDYYEYVISITTYNPEQAALRTLKWYVNYLNQGLFQTCYSYVLTHGECFLIIHLKESEYKNAEYRSIFLQTGQEAADRVREDFEMLACGIIPLKIRQKVTAEIDGIQKEW